MLLQSKPKVVGETTTNLYEVANGLWYLVTVDVDGVASGFSKPDTLTACIEYSNDCLHHPIVLHTLADIVSERLASIKTVDGSVVGTSIKFDGSGQNTFSFKPSSSDKIISVTIPGSETSAGLSMSNHVLLLVDKSAIITYEIRHATDGDESVRELCSIVEATDTSRAE